MDVMNAEQKKLRNLVWLTTAATSFGMLYAGMNIAFFANVEDLLSQGGETSDSVREMFKSMLGTQRMGELELSNGWPAFYSAMVMHFVFVFVSHALSLFSAWMMFRNGKRFYPYYLAAHLIFLASPLIFLLPYNFAWGAFVLKVAFSVLFLWLYFSMTRNEGSQG